MAVQGSAVSGFHPAVAGWFAQAFPGPTQAQRQAWPAIQSGCNTLVAAPTGSGKTLTAFLCAIDALVREGLEHGGLPDATQVVYVSPLKALSNDIHLNLEAPLAGIRAELARLGLPDVPIRTAVRTGDTPQAERALLRKTPPHILVTTPESLYVLLGSDSGRAMLGSARTVIVDEIHALAANKRGSHLALSLERLEALHGAPLTRIGLSATQKPILDVARFLVGAAAVAADGAPDCRIVDIGYDKQRDLALEVPPTPLQAVMSNEQWDEVYQRVAALVREHRTTLVFVNTRRMAERAAHHLSELLGKEHVAAHHGSMSRELRLDAEQRLKRGELQVLVATASLELGIDIGDIDLVCQLGSPRSIAAFLQRAGRAGHHVGGVPKARLFATSREELAESAALLDCVRRGELDALAIPPAPLDVLAQQIVAEASNREWDEDALYDWYTRAWPYAKLQRKDFDDVVRMLAEGFTTRRGMRAGYLHRDAVHKRLRARAGGKTTAVMSGGTIPDTGDYAVLLEPQSQQVGTVNEDFAVESLKGDIFQLGNASYRILRVEPGRVRVEDAKGAPPTIPFWLGEAPGRTDELSQGVSRLREEALQKLEDGEDLVAWLVDEIGLRRDAAQQLADHFQRQFLSTGTLPTRGRIVLERFFDESGGTQLIIHSPFGSRLNRAWGLALRKRFCRKFNFELQAAATEDAIVLSLSTSHSFPLIEVASYLHSSSAEHVLVQALLDAPLFGVRWRWNATTALALPRFVGGKKVAPQLQRMKSEDLLATVFPDQVACLENIVGERQVPDHPLVAQTLDDCLHEAMDTEGWLALLRRMESGEVQVVACDLTAPSPFAAEALTARPYAYLDDAPLEERRTQAVMARRYTDPSDTTDLARLDPEAIAAVREQAWPQVRTADEMHEALMTLGCIVEGEAEASGWTPLLKALAKHQRATLLTPPSIASHAESNASSPTGEAGDGTGTDDTAGSSSMHKQAHSQPARAEESTDSRSPEESPSFPRRRESMDVPAPKATSLDPRLRGDDERETLDTDIAPHRLWFPAERLPEALALYPQATLDPPIEAPDDYARTPWTDESAAVELLRSRLGGLGPVTVAALAQSLQLPRATIDMALLKLESDGYAMRGRFTPEAMGSDDPQAEEWCERHLLARIHRYTIGRLRREIEPVAPRDFMRFLCDWQRLSKRARASGPEALAGVLAQFEGYEAPASAWESDLLPARIGDYSINWLDDLCTAGRVAWARLRAAPTEGGGRAAPVRATPIVLLPRRQLATWSALAAGRQGDEPALSSRAQKVLDVLQRQGASFFDELVADARLLQTELEDALAELVARGQATCDSFAGLRALLLPQGKRPHAFRSRRRATRLGIEDAGRWTLTRRTGEAEAPDATTVEHVARTLLRRYGVVCWRIVEREAPWLPPWRDLLRTYHRLEARGEIRGGRFIAGLSGEQFALPEAIATLRQVRKRAHDGEWIGVSALDPLNLVGIVLPGDKVPRIAGARLLLRDGLVVATRVAGEVRIVDESMSPPDRETARRLVQRDLLPEAASDHVAAEASPPV